MRPDDRVARLLTDQGCFPHLVVRGPAPGGLDAGEIGRTLGLPVLTVMRPEPGLTRDFWWQPYDRTLGQAVRASARLLDSWAVA